MQFLTEHTPKSAKHQFTKLFQLSSGAIREGAKTNFKLPIKIEGKVLSKRQRILPKREKFQKCLKFDSGRTDFSKHAPRYIKVQLTNFVS